MGISEAGPITERKREAQEQFINLLRSYGYRAGFAQSVEEALEIVKGVK